MVAVYEAIMFSRMPPPLPHPRKHNFFWYILIYVHIYIHIERQDSGILPLKAGPMVVVGMFGLCLDCFFVWWGFVLWARCERLDSGILPLKKGPMVVVVVGMFGLCLDCFFVWLGFVLWARCERQDSGILPLRAGPIVVVGMFGLCLDIYLFGGGFFFGPDVRGKIPESCLSRRARWLLLVCLVCVWNVFFVWWGFVLWARCERQDSGILPLKAGPMVVVGMFGLFLDSFFVWVGVCSLGPM